MIQSIAYCIFLITFFRYIICIHVNLQSNTFSFDFTLNNISPLYHKLPFQMPSLPLCFGTPNPQCLNMAISLESIDTIIEITESEERHFTNQFNTSLSSSFDDRTPKSTMGFPLLNVKEYYFTGKVSLDVVRFRDAVYPKTDKLYFVTCKGRFRCPLFPIDGYLGLTKHYNNRKPNSSFLSYLLTNGIIDQMAFTLNYNSQGGGTVSFGKNNSIKYNKCDSSNIIMSRTDWFCNVASVQIGTKDYGEMALDNIAMFDSATSAVIAPLDIGMKILHLVIGILDDKCSIEETTDYAFLICDAKAKIGTIPMLVIKMSNNTELNIEWKHLLKLTEVNDAKAFISLLIVDKIHTTHHWIIGIPGLIDHSLHFDQEHLSIGIKYMNQLLTSKVANCMKVILTIGIGVLFTGIIVSLYSIRKGIIFKTFT